MKSLFLFLSAAVFALAGFDRACAADPKPVRIELPAETATYRQGQGVQLALAHCATCHSADYVATQPPMPRKFWEANVKKMKEKFGAPVPDDVTPLVDYLVAMYGAK